MLIDSFRLPKTLLEEVEKYAINQGISTKEFILSAVMEKIDFLNQEKSSKAIHNPWLKLAGKYKDDRDFDKVLTYIEEYRQELDDESEIEEK
ncbi:hypothetical protein [Geminocystis herdmanii]|uniref:hypothetical protein n=1 Tax=Geminocystis herdmanii TaxID=669359 RepID=UPI00037F8690|nr:hypothetical protein [Geminocystis herdmanii]